jgi:N-glycosylase/DNA lyase
MAAGLATTFPAAAYDLDATLTSGQAFGWRRADGAWESVVCGRWVRLEKRGESIHATAATRVKDWTWLRDYLQIDAPLADIIATFPDDPFLQAAVKACPGLRLLRQEPWECLASFILSSTKRIPQIMQVCTLLRERYGEPVAVPAGGAPAWAFPAAARLAACTEAELRACKMGFRAPYLLAAARRWGRGGLVWQQLTQLPLAAAREHLMEIPGVGRKIADCVLLFTGAFPAAFPVDTWIAQVLKMNYFGGKAAPIAHCNQWATDHFGPNAGYAQQYLFHYARVAQAARLI